MKVQCLQENLNRGLSLVNKAVNPLSSVTSTHDILLTADGSFLKLTGTDIEMAITYPVNAKVEEKGSVALNALRLVELVNSLPSDLITITKSKKGENVTIACGRTTINMNGAKASSFPKAPEVAGEPIIMKLETFRQSIDWIAFAAADLYIRPILTAVAFQFSGDEVDIAASDTFRLAVYKAKLEGAVEENVEINIPVKTLNRLPRLLSEQEMGVVGIIIDESKSHVRFELENIEVTSQLLQGRFPPYPKAVPHNYTTRVVAETNSLLNAVKSTAPLASRSAYTIRLKTKPGEIAFSARAESVGDSFCTVSALVEGEEERVALDARYLADVLEALRQSHIEKTAIELFGTSSPVIIHPVGEENYLHMIMPMIIADWDVLEQAEEGQ